jgi:hypothetical protein
MSDTGPVGRSESRSRRYILPCRVVASFLHSGALKTQIATSPSWRICLLLGPLPDSESFDRNMALPTRWATCRPNRQNLWRFG